MSQFVGQNQDGTWSNAFQTVTCPDGTKDIANGIVPPCMGKYGNKKQNDEIARLQIENSRAEQSVAYTQGVTMKLTCNDGTTGFGDYSKVDAPCKDNGGVKSLEPYTSKEPIYYILVTAGVLVAGYFAYKKFKK